jgi:predicted regulator of Ras-like GTPase activity (Roadblock/LC7/MglB family)
MPDPSRSSMLDRALADLLGQAPEVEAAAVVSFDGLPMASALPPTMDEDRVAAMSAALLSLGERAAEGLGRGGLNQVYIEGESGTVFLVSADDEAVLVAVAGKGAKVGMMLYEVRRAADAVAAVLRIADAEPLAPASFEPPTYVEPAPVPAAPVAQSPVAATYAEPAYAAAADPLTDPLTDLVPTYAPVSSEAAWPSYLPSGSATPAPGSPEQPTWS